MLEINNWFFVQLANFLLLLLILNFILFRPFLRLFRERENNTKGALESARAMDREKDSAMTEITSRLSKARDEAKTAFEGLRRKGQDVQKKTVEAAQLESVEINRKAREDLEAATLEARKKIRSDIEVFSDRIVEKLTGR